MLKFSTAYKSDGTLRKIPWSDRFVVQEPFVWEIDYEMKNKGKIVVPAWFGTDFGSIPMIFRPFFSPTKYISYVLHDYLYTYWEYSRKEADDILKEALKVEGMNRVWIFIVYATIRLFWQSHYKN